MELREFKLDTNVVNRYQEKRFPDFSYPQVVGYFSIEGEDDLKFDFSQLKYAYLPKQNKNLDLDLKIGLDAAKRKSLDDRGLSLFVQYISEKVGRLDRTTTDFVCYRGLLRLIMTTPYESEGWEIKASCINGVIYLCEHETETKRKEKLNCSDQQKQFQSYGFKFEQYVLSDTPGKPPDTSVPVDEREEFNLILRSNLGGFRLFYGAETDGVERSEPLIEGKDCFKGVKFIEVKTSRLIENQRQNHSFQRYKLIKWWCQSYLVGIEKIYCGFRDDDGIVREIQMFPTHKLHHIAREKWRPNVLMNFCVDFLAFVQRVVKSEKENPNVVWRFIWNPKNPVIVIREENNEQFQFLPQWFIQSQKGFAEGANVA